MSSLWPLFAGPESRLRLTVAISVVVFECLIAIWAATSRRHWFWRALAVWAGIMLMVPVKAWEPAWLFGLSSPLIILFIRAGAWVERRYFATAAQAAEQGQRARYRFALSDLLLFMLIVGMWLRGILEIVGHWQPSNWLGWLATSVSVAVVAVCAYACAQIPRRWRHVGLLSVGLIEVLGSLWLELPLLGVIAALAGIVAYFYAFDRRHWLAVLLLVGVLPASAAAMIAAGQWMRWQSTFVNDTKSQTFLVLLLVEVAFVICMTAVIALVHVASSRESAMRWRMAASLAVLVVLAWLVVPTSRVYQRVLALTPREAPVTRFETPINHYDEILQLAQRITALDPTPLGGAVINDNWREVWRSTPGPPAMQPLLDELMVLLDSPNAVPYDPKTDAYAGYDGHIQGWRALIRSLQAEAKVTSSGQECERSARVSLATVRMADMLSRGGVDFDALLAYAVRKIGYSELMKVIDRLPKEELQHVLAVLQQSRVEREEISAVLARQADYDEQVFGWHTRYEHAASRDFDAGRSVSQNLKWHNGFIELELTMNVLLQTHVAIRMFQYDHGRLPEDLGELVPAYLNSPAVDPNSVALRYRVAGDEFMLYGVGWDRKDDGGNFAAYNRYWATIPGSRWPQAAPGSRPPAYDADLGMLNREERIEEPPMLIDAAPPPIEEEPKREAVENR